MQLAFNDHSPRSIILSQITLCKGIIWGLLGGLTATLIMDLILISTLVVVGLPALSCFSIVGATVARLLSENEIAITGTIPLGIAAHYLIGPLMGVVFGAAAVKSIALSKVNAFRIDSQKKVLVLAVLYAEIMSQPMLALAPILLRMTASEMLQWFGGSWVMHMIWGCVLGIIWSRGLRLSIAANPK